MLLSPRSPTKIALDEKMRGCWPIRTSALSEQEIAGIRIVTEGSTGLSAVKMTIQQTIVSRRRKEVRDHRRERKTEPVTKQAALVIIFTPTLTVRCLSQRQIWTVSANRTCGTRPMIKQNTKPRSDCVTPERNKTAACDTIEKVLQER